MDDVLERLAPGAACFVYGQIHTPTGFRVVLVPDEELERKQ